MCIVCIANNINRNVYMYLNTRIFPTTGYTRVLLFMLIRRELGGMVQDVYFSLHTVVFLSFKIYLCYIYSLVQSVLFTVFRTDSVEKIYIWVSTRENLSSSRLKSAYSATENSWNIERKKSCCKLCCLCFVSLPRGAVG